MNDNQTISQEEIDLAIELWNIVFILATLGMPSEIIHTCVNDAIVKAEMLIMNDGSSLIVN